MIIANPHFYLREGELEQALQAAAADLATTERRYRESRYADGSRLFEYDLARLLKVLQFEDPEERAFQFELQDTAARDIFIELFVPDCLTRIPRE